LFYLWVLHLLGCSPLNCRNWWFP